MKRLILTINHNVKKKKKNKAKAFISNIEYYRVFAKQVNPLPPEPHLSDFYHPSETQKHIELLFVVVGTGITIYALCK